MNVLHLHSGNLYGGVETLLRTLAAPRDQRPALEPEFGLCFEGRLADELRQLAAPVHRLGRVRWSRPWTVLAARRRLRRLVATRRPDTIVCHAPWSHAIFAPVAHRAGVPLVCWLHDVASGRHWLERLAARTPPDVAVVCSRFNAASPPRLFPDVPVEVVHPPVPPPPLLDRATVRAEVRQELGTPDNAVVIVQACRLEPIKGQAVLIEALGRLGDQPGWEAWLAGGAQRPHECAFLDRLRAALHTAGIADRVRFLEQRSDVPRLLAAADLYCQPNTGPEGFGIAFIEALDAGLTVVTSRLGGAVEIVDKTCGVLVEPGDAEALAEALSRLIGDGAARARLGAAGPAKARALCDPAAVLERLGEVLTMVMSNGVKPG